MVNIWNFPRQNAEHARMRSTQNVRERRTKRWNLYKFHSNLKEKKQKEREPIKSIFIILDSFSFSRLACFCTSFSVKELVAVCNIIAIEIDFIAWKYAQHTHTWNALKWMWRQYRFSPSLYHLKCNWFTYRMSLKLLNMEKELPYFSMTSKWLNVILVDIRCWFKNNIVKYDDYSDSAHTANSFHTLVNDMLAVRIFIYWSFFVEHCRMLLGPYAVISLICITNEI